MSESRVVEIECNWRHINSWKKSEDNVLPSAYDLNSKGKPAAIAKTHILIPFKGGGRDIDVSEIRDWLDDNCKGLYTMYARFEVTDYEFGSERVWQGVSFRFKEPRPCMFFKLFWE